MKITGSEALIEGILQEGIETVFGYPGGSIMPLYDKLYDYADRLNHILVRHEQGAVHAAEGFARSTGKVGVCIATAGPGATNFVTGIADAMMDSTPVVCITAQVNADKIGTNFFQEADMINITSPITKWNYQITSAEEIPVVIPQAFHIARSGRPGPVVVSITKNAQVEVFDCQYDREGAIHKLMHSRINSRSVEEKNARNIAEATALLNKAEKPLIIAGQGVILSKAEKQLSMIANKGCIPVACTLLGRNAIDFHDHYYIGMVGMHGNLPANAMTQQADVILAVGMRFSDRVTGEISGYAPNATIIHIDIDKTEFCKNVHADIKILGDAGQMLSRICENIEYRDREAWRQFGYDSYAIEVKKVITPMLDSEKLNMGQVVDAINSYYIEQVSERDGHRIILVSDVGQNQIFGARYLKLTKRTGWITSGGLGTMGFCLPAAIGAKCGNPDAQVVAITGDGGLQMNIQELGTIMQSGIGVKIVLLNNSYLGMVRQWQDLFYNRRFSHTHIANPDFSMIAKAYGITYRKVTAHAELADAISTMAQTEGAFFLEACVDPESNVFPMVPAGASLDQIRTQ